MTHTKTTHNPTMGSYTKKEEIFCFQPKSSNDISKGPQKYLISVHQPPKIMVDFESIWR